MGHLRDILCTSRRKMRSLGNTRYCAIHARGPSSKEGQPRLSIMNLKFGRLRHFPNLHATIRHTPVGTFHSVQIIFVFGKISMLDRALTTAFRRPPILLFKSFFSTSSSCYAKKMPPKKVVAEKKTLLGRPGNNLKIGIVGLVCSLRIFVFSSPDLLLSFKACPT